MQNWVKLGKTGNLPTCFSHFTVPFCEYLEENIFRVYFSSRDSQNRSFVTYLHYDIANNVIIGDKVEPILVSGELGAFDDSGVVLFQILDLPSKRLLYYSGWMLGITVPFYFWVGAAESEHYTNSFNRVSKAPLLQANDIDPFLTGASWIIEDDGIYKMWYISGIKWHLSNDFGLRHYYTIKYAYSFDAINWIREGHICIDFKNEFEYAIARPVVIKENNIFKMWYSFRGSHEASTYRIGYAESDDGLNWLRKDNEVSIDVSDFGWDSEMICYPYIFDFNDDRYMLYNGNEYGKTGFGLAKLNK